MAPNPALLGIFPDLDDLLAALRRVKEKNAGLKDLSLREIAVFAPLVVWAFWIGIYPKPFFEILQQPVNQLVQTGIAEQRRKGRQVFYRLTHPEIHEACAIMRNIMIRRIRKEEQLAFTAASPRKR